MRLKMTDRRIRKVGYYALKAFDMGVLSEETLSAVMEMLLVFFVENKMREMAKRDHRDEGVV